jgi:hypothetical protein
MGSDQVHCCAGKASMHFDKKLGLAMGVLLVGIVGAIFFRNEPKLAIDAPRLENPHRLDERIAEKSLIPYLAGADTEAVPAKPAPAGPSTPGGPHWELPRFLKDGAGADHLASNTLAPPDPIRLDPETEARLAVPPHNRAWEAQPPAETAPASTTTGDRQVLHRVQPGETLSGIAARYLGDATRFEEIYDANRDTLASPNNLLPGMLLKIPPKSEKPSVEPLAAPAAAPPAAAPPEANATTLPPAQNISAQRFAPFLRPAPRNAFRGLP